MELMSKKELKRLSKTVYFDNLDTVRIDKKAKIERGAIIGAFVEIYGESHIASGAEITSLSTITSSKIGENTIVKKSEISDSEVGANCTIGPFAHIKQNSKLKNNLRIGNFVEIKNSTINNGTKCAHLTYIGDAIVGERVNFGCGVVIANYNGKQKFKTIIGNDVFLGCNCNLIAPIEIGDNCFIAAGTTVTKSLKNNTFCVARSEEKTKKNTFKKS